MDRAFRFPCWPLPPNKLESNPHPPRPSARIGSSGSAVRTSFFRKVLADDGRRAAYRRGAPFEVDAKDPTLERELTDDRRRFHPDRRPRPKADRIHVGDFNRRHRHKRRSLASRPEAMAGESKGDPGRPVVRKDSRIHGSSVQRAFGRRRPGRFPCQSSMTIRQERCVNIYAGQWSMKAVPQPCRSHG